jgi:excisionase family DNA binding protein
VSERVDLGALLADPARVVQVAPGDLAPLLCQLAALHSALAARLLGAPPAAPSAEAAPVPRYVTQAEAAALFNVPLSTVRYLTRRGHVPVLGRGKNRRLLPADLGRYLEECKQTGRALRPAGTRRRRPLTGTMPAA